MRRSTPFQISNWLPWLLTVIAGVFVLKAAWVSDDAYITLRTIDNFWNGYGLRWNVLERVQAYTDPLWMLVLAAVYGITREAYFTTVAISLACATVTLVLLIRRLPTASASLALVLLMSSRAFVDYSTSGLENPLSHLLLVLFWLDAGLGAEDAAQVQVQHPTRFCVLAALCCLARADLALLVGPRVLVWLSTRPPRARRSIAWAALPLVAWYAFATIYYGTPLPNTVLAKLNTGIPHAQLGRQGLYYLQESLLRDPITLSAIIAACASTIVKPAAGSIGLALGLLLHLLYIVAVGGDFMSGRFLSAPFVCAALFLARRWEPWLTGRRFAAAGATAVVSVVSLTTPSSPWRVWTPEPMIRQTIVAPDDYHGVIDERRFYYPFTGLWPVLMMGHQPAQHPWALSGAYVGGVPCVLVRGAVGLFGFHAGPAAHIIDEMALTDPLLSRQQALPHWRIGHFVRAIPDGYADSVRACQQQLYPHAFIAPATRSCLDVPDTNRIANADLARQYEVIRQLTQGPLFSVERWRAILHLHLPG